MNWKHLIPWLSLIVLLILGTWVNLDAMLFGYNQYNGWSTVVSVLFVLFWISWGFFHNYKRAKTFYLIINLYFGVSLVLYVICLAVQDSYDFLYYLWIIPRSTIFAPLMGFVQQINVNTQWWIYVVITILLYLLTFGVAKFHSQIKTKTKL